MYINVQKSIRQIIAGEIGDDLNFSVSVPDIEGRGDYTSNVAFLLAKKLGKSPKEVADSLARALMEKYSDIFDKAEAIAPGFINLTLSHTYIWKLTRDSLKPSKKKSLGKASVEFISANPTGPMHVGNARSGPIGDVIANLLKDQGYNVTREYLHNDAGAQMEKFGRSLLHWYLIACGEESTLPEDGYQGEYIEELGNLARKKFGTKLLKDPEASVNLVFFALPLALKDNMEVARMMGIRFDRIIHESGLAKTKTKKVLKELDGRGFLVKKEGAIWFSPKDEHLQDREAVVIKSDGTLVYFANDIAYHKDKFGRSKFVVDVFGENHEGHISKLRAIADVYEFPQERFKIVVYGQVTLRKNGEVVSMSKRKGNFITAREVLDEVGKDAFRYFMLQYEPRSSMVFDLTLAKEQSKQNPVYYIQYAHARAMSILSKSKTRASVKKADWSLLVTEPEKKLATKILEIGAVIEETVGDFQVQRLARYAYELAREFTHFYETTRVLDGEDKKVLAARLALVELARSTIAHTCFLMGVTAPKKM